MASINNILAIPHTRNQTRKHKLTLDKYEFVGIYFNKIEIEMTFQ